MRAPLEAPRSTRHSQPRVDTAESSSTQAGCGALDVRPLSQVAVTRRRKA